MCKFTIHLGTDYFEKIEQVAKAFSLNQVVIGGGVAANSELRKQLMSRQKSHQWAVYLPPLKYTTDNAAMIGIAAYYKFLNKEYGTFSDASESRLNY